MKIPRVTEQHGRYYYVQDLEERHRSGRPKQKWHKLTRVAEGEAALLTALGALLGEQTARGGNMKPLLEEFRKAQLGGLQAEVRKEYERMYGFIGEEFEEFNAADVEPGDVEQFLAEHFTGKLNSAGKFKALLSKFFSWCVRNSRTNVKVNPCREIRMTRPPKRKGRMTTSVYWTMYDNLTPMGRCFLELSYLTRQRPTEIRLLRESKINPDSAPGYIHFVPTKTEASSGEEVLVLITPEISACLDRARALRPAKKVTLLDRHRDPFIIQTQDGDGYSVHGIYHLWDNARQAAGLTGVTTRDVRPYALAAMKKLGFSEGEIQLAAAHTTFATTQGYLNQHRDRHSNARLPLPERPAKL